MANKNKNKKQPAQPQVEATEEVVEDEVIEDEVPDDEPAPAKTTLDKKDDKPKAPRNTSKKEAEEAAGKLQSEEALKQGIVDEMLMVAEGKRVDIQRALAYARQLLKRKK